MTWLRRAATASEPAAIFTDTEIMLLDRTAPEPRSGRTRDLDFYIVAVDRLGGYLARKHDAPPATIILWRGYSRLADLVTGFEAAAKPEQNTCG